MAHEFRSASAESQVSIFAVIVLYKMTPAEAPSYTTLLKAFSALLNMEVRLGVLLYDNTPGTHGGDGLPDFVHYIASPANTGLATAYNVATEMAAAKNFTWLLTLDQDTILPENFLQQLAVVVTEQQSRPEIAAIVPHISSGTVTVSPNWFIAHVKPKWFAKGFRGVPEKSVYALNSGSLLRVTAVQEVGGYSKLFWLDGSDIYLFRRFERANKQVFVAGDISLQHDFSLSEIQNKMSPSRYQNALAAGSAFFDLELNTAAGLGHTLLLLHLYLKQSLRREDLVVRRITFDAIKVRLFQSKRRRLATWLSLEEARIAGWQAEHQILDARGTPVQRV
jgi:hypothetical protein